jgi:hypothetical protein
VFERQSWLGAAARYNALHDALRPGCVVECSGHATQNEPGAVPAISVTVTSTLLCSLRISPSSTACAAGAAVIERLVRTYQPPHASEEADGLPAHEVAAALGLTLDSLESLRSEPPTNNGSPSVGSRALAVALSGASQRVHKKPRPTHVSAHSHAFLSAVEAFIAASPYARAPVPIALDVDVASAALYPTEDSSAARAHLADPRTALPDPRAPCMRQSAAIHSRGEYIDMKKAPQLRAVLAVLGPELIRLCRVLPHRRPVVCDIGGGRGDLAIAVAALFPNVSVCVLDANEVSLAVGAGRAAAAGLANASFHPVALQGAADDVNLVAVSKVVGGPVDVFIGLHACGGLSDAILALAASSCAAFVCVPCCYGKHPGLCGAVPWWRVLPCSAGSEAARFTADDAHVLCCLAECTDRDTAYRAAVAISCLRLAAYERSMPAGSHHGALGLSLRAFDESASLRNLVLIGSWNGGAEPPPERVLEALAPAVVGGQPL